MECKSRVFTLGKDTKTGVWKRVEGNLHDPKRFLRFSLSFYLFAHVSVLLCYKKTPKRRTKKTDRRRIRYQHSFVGWYPTPARPGLTLGELGRLFVQMDALAVDYSVITVKGLTRSLTYEWFAIGGLSVSSVDENTQLWLWWPSVSVSAYF